MPERTLIRVMIVDDHLMVRDGLKVFLSTQEDIEVVAEAGDGAEAETLCVQVQPDVILMDIVMPGVDGPTATARIRAICPEVQVIALTSFAEQDLVQQAIEAGAIGYLLKDVRPERLASAIRDAFRGHGTIDSKAAQALLGVTSEPPALGHDLSPRELEVLALLVEGQTNKEIAKQLTISVGTARLHVSNILSKLGASNRTEAAAIALQHGLVG